MKGFRLRPGKDDDIKSLLDKLPKSMDLSDVIRDALRHYLPILLRSHQQVFPDLHKDDSSK